MGMAWPDCVALPLLPTRCAYLRLVGLKVDDMTDLAHVYALGCFLSGYLRCVLWPCTVENELRVKAVGLPLPQANEQIHASRLFLGQAICLT